MGENNQMKGVKTTDLITFWGNPEMKIKSEYGLVALLEWCNRECKRIRRKNQKAAVLFDEAGNVAIANMR